MGRQHVEEFELERHRRCLKVKRGRRVRRIPPPPSLLTFSELSCLLLHDLSKHLKYGCVSANLLRLVAACCHGCPHLDSSLLVYGFRIIYLECRAVERCTVTRIEWIERTPRWRSLVACPQTEWYSARSSQSDLRIQWLDTIDRVRLFYISDKGITYIHSESPHLRATIGELHTYNWPMGWVIGDIIAHTNKDLVKKARQIYEKLLTQRNGKIWWKHIKGHSDHLRNDGADRLADEGAKMSPWEATVDREIWWKVRGDGGLKHNHNKGRNARLRTTIKWIENDRW